MNSEDDSAAAIQQRLLQQLGLRVEPEMGSYIQRRLSAGGSEAIPVIGGDARTGVPVRQLIDPSLLAS